MASLAYISFSNDILEKSKISVVLGVKRKTSMVFGLKNSMTIMDAIHTHTHTHTHTKDNTICVNHHQKVQNYFEL